MKQTIYSVFKNKKTIKDITTLVLLVYSIFNTFIFRTFVSASILIVYFFLTASYTTTVYELAQMPRYFTFWQLSLILAFAYSVFLFLFFGSDRIYFYQMSKITSNEEYSKEEHY